jgi:catechol 2,3-dioxygenase-like lactoylglutathione lyase family enzyme
MTRMGILEDAKPAMVICTRDRGRSTSFYRDILGLRLLKKDSFAAIFDLGGIALRVSFVPDFTPHGHTILGFTVRDVGAVVEALTQKGLRFKTLPGFVQDGMGIWTAPSGGVQVAWFDDPDGNILSITNA